MIKRKDENKIRSIKIKSISKDLDNIKENIEKKISKLNIGFAENKPIIKELRYELEIANKILGMRQDTYE